MIGEEIQDWCAYVGATVSPQSRLSAHKRRPTEGMRRALARHNKSVNDILFVPLQVVSSALSNAAEIDWTVMVETVGMHKLNCFGTYGNPAQSRYFWRRKKVQKCRTDARNAASRRQSESDVRGVIDLCDD